MWAKYHYDDLCRFSRDAMDWGYDAIEANAYVKSPDMLERLAEGPLPLSSLHNPIPNLDSTRGMRSYDLNLAALDEDERVEAVLFARQTIENAARLGAKAVVLHMGHVPIGKEMQRELHRMWHEGMMGTLEYRDLHAEMPALRARSAGKHLERALQTLREIEPLAADRGVMLGIETRHNMHELPNIDEAAVMLSETSPDVVGYWHDTGHAATHERLGYAKQEDWLARHCHRLIGIHLHDMNVERDHQCPGSGELDWAMIARYLPESAIRVCELGEWNTVQCVERTPAFLKHAGILAPSPVDLAEPA
jgi:sugar phosphate isomerase/epimerase